MICRDLWLVGVGNIGTEYAKVLVAQNARFTAVGRGATSSNRFMKETGISVLQGGLEKAIGKKGIGPDIAIVAVSTEELFDVCSAILDTGTHRILVEKPAGLNYQQIELLNRKASAANASVFVAYNRRFYASCFRAQQMIAEDGGPISYAFEFTEWSHQIEKLSKPKEVLENWFLANSTHVVDLAFFLGGDPESINCYVAGSMSWYPKASVFSGSGRAKNGALFSYQANWRSAGRWKVEVRTEKHAFLLCPLETLQVQDRGSTQWRQVDIDDHLDKDFKPGLYLQTKAFLGEDDKRLLSIYSHTERSKIYSVMELGGKCEY